MDLKQLTDACSRHLPAVLRWSGAVARRLRHFDIGVAGKTSGSASTDALTLADLTLQELIVAALRDCDPLFRQCRLEAEESTGDIGRFAEESEYTITIDPIDGTKQYRDKTGNGYAVMVLLRSVETVHYSLVFIPESGREGRWMEAVGDRIVCGDDDPDRPAFDVLQDLHAAATPVRNESRKIYLIGFQGEDRAKAEAVTAAGLEGFVSDDMPGSIYELQATGQFAGSLIHTPNVYDFPASLQIARARGGDALWVHNRQPVHFRELWLDERADMLRLPGIVACSESADVLETLCNLARDWNRVRYQD
ncbi:MAG: inositol monophosphatase [Planctomycetes bacterium]|nr:inositol monophosphatase [Planctomycetota bacterium]